MGLDMDKKDSTLSRFPAHRLEGALRFSANEVRVGREAPEFALRDLNGRRVRLSDYRRNLMLF